MAEELAPNTNNLFNTLDETYKRYNAESILKEYDITMSPEEIEAEYQKSYSIYTVIIKTNAAEDLKELRDHQIDFQRGLYERTQYHITQVKNKTQQSAAPNIEDQITNMEAEYQRLYEDLKSSFDQENKLHQEIKSFSKDTLSEWETLQQQHATQIQEIVKAQGLDVPENFTEQMTEALKKQSSDVSDAEWGELGIKEPTSLTEKTTLSSLIKQWQTQNKSNEEIRKNIKKLQTQDPFKNTMEKHETKNKTLHGEQENKGKEMRDRVQTNRTRKEGTLKKVEGLAKNIKYVDLEYFPEPKKVERKGAKVAVGPAPKPGEEGEAPAI